MCSGQDVEESAIRIRPDVETVGDQLPPSYVLASDEEYPQKQGHIQPKPRILDLTTQTTHVSGNRLARQLQSDATQQQKHGIEVENGWNGEMLPVHRGALTHYQRAGERGEHHG